MEKTPKSKKKSKRRTKAETRSDSVVSGEITELPVLNEFETVRTTESVISPVDHVDQDTANAETEEVSASVSGIATVRDSDPREHESLYPLDRIVHILNNDMNRAEAEDIQNEVVNLDPCEEALSILATAPLNFESGDFYSLPSIQKPVDPLESLEGEVDVFDAEVKPSHCSNIKALYNNYLLENNPTYVNQFLESLQPSCDGFELFELLSNYLRAYNHLMGCEKSLSALKDSCDDFEKLVWTLSVKQLTQTTQCDDGNTLTATYTVHIAEFNQPTFTQLTRTLKDIKVLLQDSFSLFTYSVQLCKTQIEHFLFKSFGNFNLESFQSQNHTMGYSTQDVREFANLLQRSITVFFHFLRKPLLHRSFTNDCQDWINRCSGLLLRIATIEDHFFLLNHVVRLPPHVVAKFGATLVQIPPIPIPTNSSEYTASFTHLHLDYALTLLATILNPIPKRTELLSQYQIALKTAIAPQDPSLQWVLVDSDGEDDGEESPFFKEVDLIALLQQIPFDKLFRRVLLICTEAGEDVINLNICSEHSVLKLIAFGSQLVSVLGQGLSTYYTDRYRQLIKLIGRLILHSIQYVTDQVEIFIEAGGQKFGLTQVFKEYDLFLYYAVSVLVTGKNVGTLQFLAAVPYHMVSTGMLWEIYALLTKWDLAVSQEISSEFEHELLAMSESNAFYVLTTMSNMALARQGKENQFVRVVTYHLFQVGFLSPLTRDTCSKNVRDLLGNLSQYPRVISNLLQNIKQKMDILDKLALFLIKELAFEGWKPTVDDLHLLSHWMLNYHTFSLENQVARFVIQSMNWDLGDSGDLFLANEIHSRIALLVVESHFKWERSQNVIADSVKQLSAWVTRNPDFTFWAWDIIKRLHLHAFDQHKSSPPKMSNILANLLTFETHAELKGLKKAIDEKNPIACAVALLITPYGHSLPLICTEGFELIEVLLQNSKFEAVINLLFFIIPSFVGSKESIVSCEKFRNILTTLLSADMTYIRMAKSLITTEFPVMFTKMFGEMIHTQLDQHIRFGTTGRRLVLLWLNLLTKIVGWNKDNNILYLLDIIGRFCFLDEECKTLFQQYFYALYKEMPVPSSSGIASFLFNWSYSATTVLPNTSYSQMPYLVYYILTIESTLENESGFWKSLARTLTNPKTSLENAVKKACSSTKYSTTSHYLTIYRWAQHALEMPPSHPLILIFWQNFFIKYFHRSAGSEIRGGIGERFFEGIINTAFQKKLKKRLHEMLKLYSTEINKLENDSNSSNEDNVSENIGFIVQHLKKCHMMVIAMTFWIEDPRFHQDALYIPALPSQCLPVELQTLIEGDYANWTAYINFDGIQLSARTTTERYLTLTNRLSWILPRRIPRTPNWSSTLSSRRDEFLKRLSSYDIPLSPPIVPSFTQVLPNISTPMFTDLHAMEAGLKNQLALLFEFAQQFTIQISKHTALDCTYLEHLPDLYTLVDSEALVNVQCTSGKNVSSCSGPGHAIFKFREARLNERVGHVIHQNRTDYHNLISQNLIQAPPLTISVAAVFVEDFITNLIIFHRNLMPNSEEQRNVEAIGIELFYMIVKDLGDETNFYPPTRQLFSSFLEVLGHHFVESDPKQCTRLVTTCIRDPRLVGTLTPHMNLLKTSTDTLIQIYEDVVNIPERDGDLAFVILSKLDLVGWLKKTKPRLIERSKLISLMWKAVIGESPSSASERKNQMVHGKHRSHLKKILLYDFPQHYGEILNLLLEDSEKNVVSLELWYDFFNALSRDSVRFSADMDPFLRKRELKRFAMEMDILRHQELVETSMLLGSHFKKERLAYGIYGLYPKYRVYVAPLSCLIQMISYSLISSSLKNSKGIPSHQIVEAVWPLLREIYTPWILPYDQRIVKQDCAQWIQQMNFDSASVLQPWISSDSNYAALFMNDFTDSVLFLAETLPGCPTLFSHLWNFYAENFAHPTIKDHVIALVNNCFISIPWSLFWPTMSDMELMNKVVEKYLPACHNLMGVIFAQINWTEWVSQVNGATASVKNRCHTILLNLTVHLATDIIARESPTWTTVMHVVQSLKWEFIQPNSLDPVLNWFVMSIDPRVVLSLDIIHHLDMASFQLLRIASGYGVSYEGTPRSSNAAMKIDLNRKRYLFVRTYVRLLLSASTKYKNLLQTHVQNFEKSLQNILDDIKIPAREENQQRSEFGPHLKEVIGLISNHYLGTIARNAVIAWCNANTDAPLEMFYEIIQISFSTKVPPYITVPLIETAILLSFRHFGGNWNMIGELVVVPGQSEVHQYLDVASKDGHFMVLYSLLLKRFHFYTHGTLQSVSSLTDILKNIKPKESNETVLPLLYGFFLKVSIVLLNESAKHIGGGLEKAVKRFLNALCLHLISVGDDKQGWVLLGVLGLTKASLLSVRGRLFARCMSVFMMTQLPVNAPVRLEVKEGDPVLAFETEVKPHGELDSSFQKLEELKLNRQYTEFVECIDSAITFIQDPLNTLSSYEKFSLLLTCQLFSEPYLIQEELHE